MIPNDLDALLRRNEIAAALTEAGYPTAPATLATKATRGGGPPFRSWGRWPLYRWGDALAWAQNRLSPARTSTSEADTDVPPGTGQRHTAVVPERSAAARPVSSSEHANRSGTGTALPAEPVNSSSATSQIVRAMRGAKRAAPRHRGPARKLQEAWHHES
jgi:hypothetical protein